MNILHKQISDNTSPLFRIMSIANYDIPQKRFANNIICSHIGNGYFITVTHNLKKTINIPESIPDSFFQNEFISYFKDDDKDYISSIFIFDSNKKIWRYNQNEKKDKVISIIEKSNFSINYKKAYEKKIYKPFLIFNFKEKTFYNSNNLISNCIYEKKLDRYRYLLEVEISHASWKEDICIYKLKNRNQELINKIPHVDIDFNLYLDDNNENYKSYFLQSSPDSYLGRLLTEVKIKGISNHYNSHKNYTHDGIRYYIEGYAKFGSSGGAYLIYKKQENKIYLNAIQSELCPIQFTYNDNRSRNFQYRNSLATPINNIKSIIEEINNTVS